MKLLVIEDDANISFALKRFFAEQGYEVNACFSLAEAYQLHPERHDFIILDLNLPDGEGFEYLAYVRSREIQTPIILLTVRDQERDVVRGLKMGADDYITKPFSLAVLKARIEAILRRASPDKNENTLQCGTLKLDRTTKTAFLSGKTLELSQREYELLEYLTENQERTLPRERILDRLWGWEREEVFDNTLSVTVKRLRAKLAPYQHYIRTVRGIGYRMTEEEQ
ncbi:MAG TPA: DNA-binding response regulator [Firmicutes bacterium]|jgi:DNA-binding response OmpR family regulator|nr:DNA-binding response regulator [Bacillota bacterium]